MLDRIYEYFSDAKVTGFKEVASSIPPMLYRQERDWTCSIACLRSIASKFTTMEDESKIIEQYELKPGPHYARDIESKGLLKHFDYEINIEAPDVWRDLHRLYKLLKDGATIMVETCRSFDHWLVLLAYFTNGAEYTEDQSILMWDPYYNEPILMRASEFCDIWLSGNWEKNKIICDFIAIKGLKK